MSVFRTLRTSQNTAKRSLISHHFYWGERIHALHLGPEPIWRVRLTAANLARALEACVKPIYSQHALQLRDTLIGDGVERAALALEAIVGINTSASSTIQECAA